MFESIGADGFARRARIELRATGETTRKRSVETLSDLTAQEAQISWLAVDGASNAEIADQLVITVETVKTHVKRILRKIGAINRSEAIALYMEARTGSWRHTG